MLAPVHIEVTLQVCKLMRVRCNAIITAGNESTNDYIMLLNFTKLID